MPPGDPTADSIETVQNVYSLGYMIEEVRISYRRDVKLTVGDMAIDAKEGDMSSLPRWAAKILFDQGAIEFQDSDVSSYILKSINRERIARPHDISGIDSDFYIRINDYLDTMRERERERERENLVIQLNTFVASRLEKIVKMAAASPLTGEMESKLSAEEKELYKFIHGASSDFKKKVLKKFD